MPVFGDRYYGGKLEDGFGRFGDVDDDEPPLKSTLQDRGGAPNRCPEFHALNLKGTVGRLESRCETSLYEDAVRRARDEEVRAAAETEARERAAAERRSEAARARWAKAKERQEFARKLEAAKAARERQIAAEEAAEAAAKAAAFRQPGWHVGPEDADAARPANCREAELFLLSEQERSRLQIRQARQRIFGTFDHPGWQIDTQDDRDLVLRIQVARARPAIEAEKQRQAEAQRHFHPGWYTD